MGNIGIFEAVIQGLGLALHVATSLDLLISMFFYTKVKSQWVKEIIHVAESEGPQRRTLAPLSTFVIKQTFYLPKVEAPKAIFRYTLLNTK